MIEKILPVIKEKQQELMLANVKYPDMTNGGMNIVRACQWQGLEMALDIIYAALREQEEN